MVHDLGGRGVSDVTDEFFILFYIRASVGCSLVGILLYFCNIIVSKDLKIDPKFRYRN